jgi:hypothetical protein
LNSKIKTVIWVMGMLVALAATISCRTAKPLPAANLSASGWHVLQGQVLWKPDRKRSEVAADFLLATNVTGDLFVQLTKDPFPLVTAEVLGHEWQIQFEGGKYSWHGNGAPPKRFPWFQFPRALSGEQLAGPWRFENVSSNSWRLENPKSGETLEGGFFP